MMGFDDALQDGQTHSNTLLFVTLAVQLDKNIPDRSLIVRRNATSVIADGHDARLIFNRGNNFNRCAFCRILNRIAKNLAEGGNQQMMHT